MGWPSQGEESFFSPGGHPDQLFAKNEKILSYVALM
jgi:hypothetical protein